MTQFDLSLDNQNLKRMLKLIVDDIAKKCTHCEKTAEFAGYEIDCSICSLGTYNKTDSISAEENLLDTYAKTVKIKNPKPVSL